MFAKNIKFLRSKKNWTQSDLAEKLGYTSVDTISKWELDINKPRFSKVSQIAELFHVDISDLLNTDLQKQEAEQIKNINNISTPSVHALKILGTICAGDGMECEQQYDGVFFVDNSIRADYCLTVKGNSMKEAGIEDDDKAFLVSDCSYTNGHIYAVLLPDTNTAILRKVYWQDRQIILQPCNDDYKPIVTTEEETKIIGECIGVYSEL